MSLPGKLLFGLMLLSCVASLGYAQDHVGGVVSDTTVNRVDTLLPVVVQQRYVRQQTDRYTVSMTNNPIAVGKTAAEVLGLLPSMSRVQGVLLLQGQPLSRIHINGRKVDDQREIEAIQADQIERIEVLYRSGSQYDAQTHGGVINIKLKSLSPYDYFGVVGVVATWRPSYGLGSDNVYSIFNQQFKKVRLYNYLSYGDFRNISQYDQQIFYPRSDTLMRTMSSVRGWDRDFSDQLTLEYEPSDGHRLGVSLGFGVGRSTSIDQTESTLGRSNEVAVEQVGSEINRINRYDRYQATLRYDWAIDPQGTSFSFEADYLGRNARDCADYNIRNKSVQVARDQLAVAHDLAEATARLTLPVGGGGSLNSGIHYYYRRIVRNGLYENEQQGGWVPDPQLGGHFSAGGQGAAIFSEYAAKWDRWALRAGLRLQWDNLLNEAYTHGVKTAKDFWELYPSVEVGYTFDQAGDYTLRLSYERTIDHVPYNEISPLIRILSPYSYTRGNPDLALTISHCVGLSASLKQWNVWYYYYRVQDDIEYVTQRDPINPLVCYSMPMGVGQADYHSVGTSVTFKPFGWWNLNVSLSMNNKYLRYTLPEGAKSVVNTMVSGGVQNSFDFAWRGGAFLNLGGETMGFFDDKRMYPVWNIGVGWYQYFFGRQLLVRIEAQPVWSQLRSWVTEKPELVLRSRFLTSQQNFGLRLSYNFGRGSVRGKQTETIQSIKERQEIK